MIMIMIMIPLSEVEQREGLQGNLRKREPRVLGNENGFTRPKAKNTRSQAR